ncbi:MAG: cytochrome c [Verrucomicrobiaceae bacterium]|nr:cytochrome c [Verrucomicrobiaceae bacterium]
MFYREGFPDQSVIGQSDGRTGLPIKRAFDKGCRFQVLPSVDMKWACGVSVTDFPAHHRDLPKGAVGRLLPPDERNRLLNTARGQVGGTKLLQHWPQAITTHAELEHAKAPSYVLDDIPLPLENPWKRNVRLADIDFLDDKGNAVGVTMDGDVWLISGLVSDLKEVKWKRFASGLHEPMSIVVRGQGSEPQKSERQSLRGQQSRSGTSGDSSAASKSEGPTSDPLISASLTSDILVFDRNGIWKLLDTNGDGECDRYEMFCNLFAQTAETREFPNSMKLGPKGELYISKGGQEGTTFGKHNGTVIKVAPDGKSFEVIGYGLRQPFLGVHPKTGLVTASDQQGNYVPSTPLHIISDHHFYGHLPTIAPKEQYPETITEPLTWIPHPVNPSSVSQVWLTDAKMGPLNDEFMLVGYNRPELFRVLMNTRFQRPQATVMSFWRDFDFGPLNAHVNPADGQLYVVGFQIWGTTAKKISGLARIRYTGGERVMLKECTPTDKGLLLRFNAKLDAKLAPDPASYSAERWNYKRTAEYGSPHLKLDGTPGQEWVNASSAYLSKDGMSVLVGIPDMKAGVHQMRIGWGLKSEAGLKAENTAYFSPWDLMTFDPVKEGFGDIKVDLTPRKTADVALAKPTVEEGQRLYQMVGCMACHSTDGTTVGKVGPSWRGIFGTEREIGKANGENVKTPLKVKADEAYLHESIVNPPAKVVKGFEKFDAGMPIYNGILNESQIQSLILFIKSLK